MITLEANYSKKIGLPGYSSHQFSITLRTELPDTTKVQEESARLYRLLQEGVDQNIQAIGFLPHQPNENGHAHPKANGNGHSNGYQNGRQVRPGTNDSWKCSPKQKELILKVITENQLDKNMVEDLAVERFGLGVKALNKLQASGLIEELLEKYPNKRTAR
jgi:hypothetical protein